MSENFKGNIEEYNINPNGRVAIKIGGKTYAAFGEMADNLKHSLVDGLKYVEGTYYDKEKDGITYHNILTVDIKEEIKVTEESIEKPKYKYSFDDKEEHTLKMAALKDALMQLEIESRLHPDELDTFESITQRREALYKEFISLFKEEIK